MTRRYSPDDDGVDEGHREGSPAPTRARRRAQEALEFAARAGEAARCAEQHALAGPVAMSESWARLAAIQRRSQRRHLVAARLNAAYASRMLESMQQPDASRGAAFMAAIASVSTGSGVVFTVSGCEQQAAVVAASDATARTAYDLERSFFEGPATDAIARRAIVWASGELAAMWPLFGLAISRLGVHAITAAPLCLRGRCFGSITTLNPHPDGPGRGLQADLADAVVYTILTREPPTDSDGLAEIPLFEGDQMVVHQAAGMVAAQSGLDIPDAHALIRARAFAESQPVATIAAQVLSRKLQLVAG